MVSRSVKAVSRLRPQQPFNTSFRASVRPFATVTQSVDRRIQVTNTRTSLTTSRRPNFISQDASRATARAYATQADEPLQRTGLYDLHVKHGGKMVPFGGFEMPVQYTDLSIGESHKWTREKCSLFDVGHMVQHFISGPGAQGWLQRMTPSGLAALLPHQSTLSCLLHPGSGGIVDDTVITRLGPDNFYVVTNAGCRSKDLLYFRQQLEEWRAEGNDAVEWQCLDELRKGLIALQGPLSADIIEPLIVDAEDRLDKLYFGNSKYVKLRLSDGSLTEPVLVSRGGYTGEDGFEISTSETDTPKIVETLLLAGGEDRIRLAGLGARDSLRLEAGMCLYGHDLDDSTTPVEAGLSWVIGKDRRAEGGFHGAEAILSQLKPKKEGGAGVERRRIGLLIEGAPAREGADIVDADGKHVGKVTSGAPSPTLGKNIAMGYVKSGLNKAGTELAVLVRGKPRKAMVTKMPFLPSKYWKGGMTPG